MLFAKFENYLTEIKKNQDRIYHAEKLMLNGQLDITE